RIEWRFPRGRPSHEMKRVAEALTRRERARNAAHLPSKPKIFLRGAEFVAVHHQDRHNAQRECNCDHPEQRMTPVPGARGNPWSPRRNGRRFRGDRGGGHQQFPVVSRALMCGIGGRLGGNLVSGGTGDIPYSCRNPPLSARTKGSRLTQGHRDTEQTKLSSTNHTKNQVLKFVRIHQRCILPLCRASLASRAEFSRARSRSLFANVTAGTSRNTASRTARAMVTRPRSASFLTTMDPVTVTFFRSPIARSLPARPGPAASTRCTRRPNARCPAPIVPGAN